MEYPGIKSAFEVFTSKLTKKQKDGSPKNSASPQERKSVKRKSKQEKKDAVLVSNNIAKKKKLQNSIANDVDDSQNSGVIQKKRKRNVKIDGTTVVGNHFNEVKTVNVTKKKIKKNSLKAKSLSVENGSLEETFGEESVLEAIVDDDDDDDVETGDISMSTPEMQGTSTLIDETGDSSTITPVVKLQKRKSMSEKNSAKDLKKGKGKKVLKKKKKNVGEVEDSEESPSTAADKCPDSVEEGKQLFAWLIDPITPEEFFRCTWEQRPLVIKKYQPNFYEVLMSTATIHKMLERDNVQFGKNVDVTSYRDGKRETHNPEGRAFPAVVWSHYNTGCSVRLLNPQTFIPKLHLLNATLQEYFGCLVGANAYLTPPNSQGFAPHYDDIEAFILQLEGQKAWKLYAPRTEQEVLARFSSDNLAAEDIGEPIMEVVLNPGDLLYFPRGTIHQAHTMTSHSLHITLSCYQRNTWGDLLEKAIPVALKYALEEDPELRKGLPRDYLRYMGSVHSDQELPSRQAFTEHLRSLLNRVFEHLPVDAAVDQLGKQFMHDALPPVLTTAEKQCTVFGDGLKMLENGKLCNHAELELKTRVKLLRAHILRLVVEDEDTVKLYHYVDNSLEYHGNEPQFLELALEAAPAVELLISSYPEFITVASLPLDTNDEKVNLASELWKTGLLMTDGPLNVVFDE